MRTLALFLILSLSGCSVFMAANSSEEPNLSSIRIGHTERPAVDGLLGKPITLTRKYYGDEAVYQFFTNDEASYSRALLYAGLDLVTGFMAEFFTSPVESLQGDRNLLTVLYTPTGVVKDLRHQVMSAPLPNPNKVVKYKFGVE